MIDLGLEPARMLRHISNATIVVLCVSLSFGVKYWNVQVLVICSLVLSLFISMELLLPSAERLDEQSLPAQTCCPNFFLFLVKKIVLSSSFALKIRNLLIGHCKRNRVIHIFSCKSTSARAPYF